MFFAPHSRRLLTAYQAPLQRVVADPDHPLSLNLRSLWLPGQDAGQNQLRNYAPDLSARNLTLPISGTSTPTHTSTRAGIASVHTGVTGGGYYRSTANNPWGTATASVTIAAIVTVSGAQTAATFPAWYALSESTGHSFCAITTNTTNNSPQYEMAIGTGQVTCNPGVTLTAGQQALIIGTSRSTTDAECWLLSLESGVLSKATDATSISGSTVTTYESIGGANYGTDNFLNGTVAAAWFWNRSFTSDQLAEFITEPFANLLPARQRRGNSTITNNLAAAQTSTSNVTAQLTTEIDFAATPTSTSNTSSQITTGVSFAAGPLSTSNTSSQLTNNINFATTPVSTSNTSSQLTTAINVASAPTSTSNTSSQLTTTVSFAATPASTSTTSSQLTTEIDFAAAPASTTSMSAPLTTSINFAAAPVTSTSNTAAQLTTAISPAAAFASTSTISSLLTTEIDFAAALASTASTSSPLTTSINFAAVPAASTSNISVELTSSINASATLVSTSSTLSQLTTGTNFVITPATSTSSISSQLTTNINFAGAQTSTSTTQSQLTTGINFAGNLTSASTTQQSITTEIDLTTALTSVSVTQSDLTVSHGGFAADQTSSSVIQSQLTTSIGLIGQFLARSQIVVALTSEIVLAQNVTSTSELTSALTNNITLAQNVASISEITSDLTNKITFGSGLASQTSISISDLTTEVVLAADTVSESQVFPDLHYVPPTIITTFDLSAASTSLFSADLDTAIALQSGLVLTSTILATRMSDSPWPIDPRLIARLPADINMVTLRDISTVKLQDEKRIV